MKPPVSSPRTAFPTFARRKSAAVIRRAFTLIELREEFSILDSRFSNDQANTSAILRRGSAQSKIENPKSKISRAWRGFTLIELLTVIAIIGILAGILIPVTGVVRDKARSAQCISNLRQLHVGLMLYVNDNKGGFLPVNESSTNKAWWQALYPAYINNRAVFACPKDDTGMSDANWALRFKGAPNGKVSYAGRVTKNGLTQLWGKPFTTFEEPSCSVLLAEYHIADYQLAQYWHCTKVSNQKDLTRAHGGKAGVLLMDGHCKLLDPDSGDFDNLKTDY
ncbi:MAG: prepilin-type N-terminal cleavage/methylation domain-containing protein [Opitutaceae bacterium]|jgi:general secretion pathway protein G|nr:prepilin-type N-terminal cleavage/methylation domain-containing protein [Opitutaceae bacterium]